MHASPAAEGRLISMKPGCPQRKSRGRLAESFEGLEAAREAWVQGPIVVRSRFDFWIEAFYSDITTLSERQGTLRECRFLQFRPASDCTRSWSRSFCLRDSQRPPIAMITPKVTTRIARPVTSPTKLPSFQQMRPRVRRPRLADPFRPHPLRSMRLRASSDWHSELRPPDSPFTLRIVRGSPSRKAAADAGQPTCCRHLLLDYSSQSARSLQRPMAA